MSFSLFLNCIYTSPELAGDFQNGMGVLVELQNVLRPPSFHVCVPVSNIFNIIIFPFVKFSGPTTREGSSDPQDPFSVSIPD